MASINKCFFLGNLTRDPDARFTPKGTAITDFGLAMNRVWKDDSGKKMEEATFIDVTCWGRTAEIAGEYLHKGDLVHVECHAQLDQWEDKESGKKRSKIKFVVDHLTLMPNGEKGERRTSEGDQREEARQTRKPASRPETPRDPDLDAEQDDIPFRSIDKTTPILILAKTALKWLKSLCAKTMLTMPGDQITR